MSAQSDSLGNCPDCGQEYRTLDEITAAAQEPTVREVPMSEVLADYHRDLDCPVQRERDHIASIEAALRYFGGSAFLVKVGEIISANEHDAGIIWGDAERWIKREHGRGTRPPRPLALVGEGGGDSLDVLNLSSRARRALCAANITTVGQLTQKTEWQLLSIKDFGKKALNEVRAALKERGLSTADGIEEGEGGGEE